MNRKPIFDAVRQLLGRGFSQSEVETLDRACDLAEAAVATPPTAGEMLSNLADAVKAAVSTARHRLGALSEIFESGNRGPGTVSSGAGDPGGVSYGVYQLSSNAGTLGAFLKGEGKRWAAELGAFVPGSGDFSNLWKAIASREPDDFRAAQHQFIERTHYRQTVADVLARKGLDLDKRHDAVRDATWSVAVQHGRAATILIRAIDATDPTLSRDDPGYDRALVEQIYKARTAYVLEVAANPKLPQSQRNQLISITRNRYPSECEKCLAMFRPSPAATPAPPPPPDAAPEADGTIDGNMVAQQHGVGVKSSAVKIARLHPAMAKAIAAVAQAVRTLGLPQAVITSGNDSNHMAGSLHFKDRALDFRGNNISVELGKRFQQEVSQILGSGYDVLFEVFLNPANNHLHVEFDPK
ncbi:hypothetical protein E2493_04680 [Sphingomonas parva]|uniref:Type VI secretion system spike protein VgrG3-like C-terminal domain-containing protein n=1 Tax=Sphingomonas parva TaxID=2555898 RepID=A0A4Y8ZXE7_9SPHN|nr:hypothetical protein [Sphingomonas parva]TFI59489.1 hypothetical protein E2493_04680 [Sphingomonas parva]